MKHFLFASLSLLLLGCVNYVQIRSNLAATDGIDVIVHPAGGFSMVYSGQARHWDDGKQPIPAAYLNYGKKVGEQIASTLAPQATVNFVGYSERVAPVYTGWNPFETGWIGQSSVEGIVTAAADRLKHRQQITVEVLAQYLPAQSASGSNFAVIRLLIGGYDRESGATFRTECSTTTETEFPLAELLQRPETRAELEKQCTPQVTALLNRIRNAQ
ncbi:MAG: hypothetical protein K1X75_16225 [Leptospirales bacterium]|nr:hypothetical protein [Leptospirales bacterium]